MPTKTICPVQKEPPIQLAKELLDDEQRHRDLNDAEYDFVNQCHELLTHGKPLSQKQRGWLRRIHADAILGFGYQDPADNPMTDDPTPEERVIPMPVEDRPAPPPCEDEHEVAVAGWADGMWDRFSTLVGKAEADDFKLECHNDDTLHIVCAILAIGGGKP